MVECPICKGKKETRYKNRKGEWVIQKCPECNGTGERPIQTVAEEAEEEDDLEEAEVDRPVDKNALEKAVVDVAREEASKPEKIFSSRCRNINLPDIGECIAVPVDIFRWIVCVPYGGKYVETNLPDGTIKRIPKVHMDNKDDWSLDIDTFFLGKSIGPFKRFEIVLDRDANDRLPIIRFEMIG